MIRSAAAALSLFLAACGVAPARPSAAPDPRGSAPTRPPLPGASSSPSSGLPEPPAGLPAAPASCAPLLASPTEGDCGARPLDALDAALGVEAVTERDARLAGLESCASFPRGLMRALRAELAPAECGDALVEPALAAPPGALDADVRDALTGLGLAARLARLASEPPRLAAPFDKAHFTPYFNEQLAPWISAQARAIGETATSGAKLHGYGLGIVAVEAGVADLRFVELVRDVPLPVELAGDAELKELYYSTLDQVLDPRKDRGRDAALVGLRRFAELGALADARVDRARALLSALYGGRRIDRLDELLLPALPPLGSATVEERLAARLPTFYGSRLLPATAADDPRVLRALLERGLPPAVRARLESTALSAGSRMLYSRALVRLGELYWRSGDFVKAAAIAGGSAPDDAGRAEVELIQAVASALEGGPRDAAQMMLEGPLLPRGVGNVARLDALARGEGRLAGMAAWNAALILGLNPPGASDPGFFRGLAGRYRSAAARLDDARTRAEALARAKSADAVAAAVAKARPTQ
ncbi:MAG: hypothetical protein OZ921_08655 [Sorangiineae bacterium]|nr:hypothetical protein [Polyangiaceae bacterium]MEB2322570.1 hypothetical protein [Sorangiineae bacterium]